MFDLFKYVNKGNDAGVEDGSAKFDLSKITAADIKALNAAGNAPDGAAAPKK